MLKKRKVKSNKVTLVAAKSNKKERKNFVQIRDLSDDSDDARTTQNNEEECPPPQGDERTKRKEFLKRTIDEMIKKDPKKAKLVKDLQKPLTLEVINELKETENKFHSNLFRMQATELLNQLKPSTKTAKRITLWIEEFNALLADDSKLTPCSVEAVKCSKLPLFPFKVKTELLKNVQLEFDRPEEPAFVIGSQSLAANANIVDICIEMPTKLRGSEHLNMRYHYKRFYYLLKLADQLKSFKTLIETIEIGLLKNDPLKPVLIISPAAEKFGKKLKFQIHAICKQDDLKLMRFLPEKNNVRLQCIDESTSESENTLFPTPHYNVSMLADLTLRKNHDFLQSVLSGNQNILDALSMLKCWLKQRNFDVGYYGFDGYVMAMFVSYLVQTKKIYATMSSYQIVRLVWHQMGQTQWDQTGISLANHTSTNDANLKPIEHFHKYYDVVFLDITGYTNICANLSVDLYRKVRSESVYAIKCLDNAQINCFQALFLQKYTISLQYDHILTIKGDNYLRKLIKPHAGREDQLNYISSNFPCIRKLLLKVLRQGLGNRVVDIVPLTSTISPWAVGAKPVLNNESITICLTLNPEMAFNVVDRGPQANQTKLADEFRKFWGPKSELRRFKDGAITESCVWCSMKDPIAKKRLICEQICRHLLELHFNVSNTHLIYSSNQFDVALSRCDQKENRTNEEMALNCIKSFDGLSRYLRDMDGLPLDIISVLGIDPIFRYCDVDYQMGNAKFDHEKNVFLTTKVCHGIIQLAPSGKWPDDLIAIKHLKAAFHLHLAKQIRDQNMECHARGQWNHVDILYEGYLFRLQIIHPKEIVLMKQHQDKAKTVSKDTLASLKMEMGAYILPKLTSSLHALHLQQPTFGASVRMAKRWLNSQLIDSHLWPEECTELILASIFLKTDVQRAPVQPQAGFFKFLHFLAQTDFNTDMVIVNFNDELKAEELEALDTKFINARSSFPALSIVTSCDFGKQNLWTKKAPILPVLNRAAMLAKIALETVNTSVLNLDDTVVKHVFSPSFSGYDVIIKLDQTYRVPTNLVDVNNFTARKTTFAEKRPPVAGFNPFLVYLQKLREAYDQFAIFFYDAHGGDHITVLWKPTVSAIHQMALTHMNGSCLTKDNHLQTNKAEMINDFMLIGHELVLDVVVNNQ